VAAFVLVSDFETHIAKTVEVVQAPVLLSKKSLFGSMQWSLSINASLVDAYAYLNKGSEWKPKAVLYRPYPVNQLRQIPDSLGLFSE
jgi:hypothetical protein